VAVSARVDQPGVRERERKDRVAYAFRLAPHPFTKHLIDHVVAKVGQDALGIACRDGLHEESADDSSISLVDLARGPIAHPVGSPLDRVGRMVRRVELQLEFGHEDETCEEWDEWELCEECDECDTWPPPPPPVVETGGVAPMLLTSATCPRISPFLFVAVSTVM
jgi:hypothetical protein